MPDYEPPRLVATNTDAELERERALAEVSWTVRELTANLLRIVRGAGKEHYVGRQLDDLIRSMAAYHGVAGRWPYAGEIATALSVDQKKEWFDTLSDANRSVVYAKESIIRGALQQAASRLLGQTTQERAGESEMEAGIRALEAARAEQRREYKLLNPEIALARKKRKPVLGKGKASPPK